MVTNYAPAEASHFQCCTIYAKIARKIFQKFAKMELALTLGKSTHSPVQAWRNNNRNIQKRKRDQHSY